MRPCALTIPVLGERSAPTVRMWGSSAPASAAVRSRISTPLAVPRESSSSRARSSSGTTAVISLPTRAWGTPWAAQSSYSRWFPSTHRRALREPVG